MGPKPCPVNNLTADILTEKLNTLTDAEMKESAIALAAKMVSLSVACDKPANVTQR